MNLNLMGKVAMITGGASGIGEAITRSLAHEGVNVVIVDRDAARAEKLVHELASKELNADFVQVELTDPAQIANAILATVKRHQGLDILINNAGVNDSVSITAGVDAFRQSLDKNLIQVYACVHHAFPYLKESKGCIVNIGSKVAETGQGGTNGYAASKGGLHSLTREWAIELAPHDIRVNTVVPAETWTPLYENWLNSASKDPAAARTEIESNIPYQRRMTTCQEIADTAVFLSSNRSSHTTGQIIYVDGGYTHLDRACTVKREHLFISPDPDR